MYIIYSRQDVQMKDEILWKKMKEGDRSAFESIYRNHIQALYKYGARIHQDVNLLEDCIHDLFLDLWNNRATIGDTNSIAPYLLTSLRRKMYKKIKSSQKTHLTESNEALDQIDFAWPAKETEDNNSNLVHNQIQSFVQYLTPRQKEVIYLKYIRGLDYDEIGEVLDMKYQSVRNLVHRALQKMRDHATLFFLIFVYIIEYNMDLMGFIG